MTAKADIYSHEHYASKFELRVVVLCSMAGVLILAVLFTFPLPMLIFYPLYFFFLFAPLAAIFGVVYFEAARGMIE